MVAVDIGKALGKAKLGTFLQKYNKEKVDTSVL